jgi:hypothetical protein
MLKIKVSAKTIKNYTRSSCLCFLAFDAPQLAAGSFTTAKLIKQLVYLWKASVNMLASLEIVVMEWKFHA